MPAPKASRLLQLLLLRLLLSRERRSSALHRMSTKCGRISH
jgi:hypothetical protein